MIGGSGLTRSEIARRAGIGIEAVRFYERKGLIGLPRRTPAGYRQYDADALQRLHFIQRAKRLGFSLREVRELISMHLDAGTDCTKVERQARKKLADVRAKIRDLRRLETALVELTDSCSANPSKAECPLMNALDKEE